MKTYAMNPLFQKYQRSIAALPVQQQQQIFDFVEYVVQRTMQHREQKKEKKFNFKWAGGLRDVSKKGKYSSVALQKKSLEWR